MQRGFEMAMTPLSLGVSLEEWMQLRKFSKAQKRTSSHLSRMATQNFLQEQSQKEAA